MAFAWASVGLLVATAALAAVVLARHLCAAGLDVSQVTRAEILDAVLPQVKAMLLGTFLAFVIYTEGARRKVSLLAYGAVVMVFTTDMSWSKKKLPDPDALLSVGKRSKKRIIFIRHGESKWNQAFNKSKLPHKFFMSTMTAFVNEMLVLPIFDSVLFDSPLNSEGYSQARILARVIETYSHPNAKERMAREAHPALEQDMAALRGEPGSPSAIVVSSNLRRAAQTAVVALRSRLSGRFSYRTGLGAPEQVKVLPCLQEVSRNVDTLALAPPFGEISLPGIEEHIPEETCVDLGNVLDVSDSAGNKPIFGTGLQRLEKFCTWAAERDEDMIITAGHSLWFRHFFRTFLPRTLSEELAIQAKDLKMKNGGAVGFDLEFGQTQDGRTIFRIDPASISVVHGGFDVKKKKKGALNKIKGALQKLTSGGGSGRPKEKAS
uniref:Uncharacterized protein n=1 Tax=Rhizochromulina marina TaxID=1034831 RepID=A0A7S2W3E9_9STRA|mmetsp:Transcript_12607/g.36526  ORF Transcript_12607/g.36526 Transcript_12607/m.36526 type:complete len:435 (+) Transcript_12607:135-1439(+)